MILRRFGVFSVAKLMGCFYALVGLAFGAFFTFLALIGAAIGVADGAEGDEAGIAALVLGVGAVIIAPIIYGIAGFLVGIIVALLYNLIAAIAGGIELELVPTEPNRVA